MSAWKAHITVSQRTGTFISLEASDLSAKRQRHFIVLWLSNMVNHACQIKCSKKTPGLLAKSRVTPLGNERNGPLPYAFATNASVDEEYNQLMIRTARLNFQRTNICFTLGLSARSQSHSRHEMAWGTQVTWASLLITYRSTHPPSLQQSLGRRGICSDMAYLSLSGDQRLWTDGIMLDASLEAWLGLIRSMI